MEKRVCSKCNTSKIITEFPFRNKSRGTRHSYCLLCGRQWVKNHYAANARYYIKKARDRRKRVINELNGKLYDYLEQHPCVDCGENDPVVLEFDHVRGEKSYNVTSLGWRLCSWDTLMREIAKCVARTVIAVRLLNGWAPLDIIDVVGR